MIAAETDKKLRPKFKLWLSTSEAEGIFGDGKWRLLKAIDSKGSLAAAAETLGISYRKAWGDLQKAEKHLKVALVKKQRGGRRGGRTCLTAQGKDLVEVYGKFRRSIEKAVKNAFSKDIEGLMK